MARDAMELFVYVAVCAMLAVLLAQVSITYVSPWGHFITEVLPALVGLWAAYVMLGRFVRSGEGRSLLFGFAFFHMAIFDILHSFAFAEMPQTILPVSTNIQLQFLVGARLLGAPLLLAGALLSGWMAGAERRRALLAAALGVPLLLAFAVSAAAWVSPSPLPTLYVEGAGLTALRIGVGYLIIAVYVLTMLVSFLNYRRTGNEFDYWLAAGLVFLIFNEWGLISFRDIWQTYFWLGHMCKVVGFAAILVGLRRIAGR